MNPGPIKYPSTNCKKGVRSNQRAIQCDFCDERNRMKCTTIPLSQFNKLSTSDETFYCTKYIDRLPCFTDSFFHNISIRSSDTEFSNTGSSECGTYQQNVNTVDELGIIHRFSRLVTLLFHKWLIVRLNHKDVCI